MNLGNSIDIKKEYAIEGTYWSTMIFQEHFDPVYCRRGGKKNNIYSKFYQDRYTDRYTKNSFGVDEILQEAQ